MRERIEEIRSALEAMASAMVEHKDQIEVAVERHGPQVTFRIRVAQPDMRRLIGSSGTNFDALSTLVWSMGNQTQPPIKTRLAKLEPLALPVGAEDADEPTLLESILLAMGIPSLQDVDVGHMRGMLNLAGSQADELRAYLLGMRADDLQGETKRALERR